MSQDEIFARAFAQILTDCFYGVPLLDPLNSDDAQIGDVGYIQNGRFKKLFSGAVPRPPPISPFSSVQKTDIPPTSISEKAGGSIYGAPQPEAFSDMIATVLHNWAVNMAWHHRYTLPRELYSGTSSNSCVVDAGISLVGTPDHGFISNRKTFARIVTHNCRTWLEYTSKVEPRHVTDDGIVFVTGFIKGTRNWDNYCRISEHPVLRSGSVFNAGCNCEEVTELRHDCKKPHPDRTTYNQPIFLNYHKIKCRPRMLSRSSEKQSRLSPHQSGYAKIHDDNHDECDPETLFKHPMDWALDYIFENAPEAEIAFVSDHQIHNICKSCDPQPLVQQMGKDVVRKSWRPNNYYFFLQYHQPKIVVIEGVATFGPSSNTVFQSLCKFSLYKQLRTMVVSHLYRNSPLPRPIPSLHIPTASTLEARIFFPTSDELNEGDMREKPFRNIRRSHTFNC